MKIPTLESISCPMCRCSSAREIQRLTDVLCGVPGVYTVCRCDDCGHLYMNPRPTEETLYLCYPSNYSPHLLLPEETTADSQNSQKAVPWYLQYLPLKRIPGLRAFYYWLMNDLGQPCPDEGNSGADSCGKRVFELGCSTGTYLMRLRSRGWIVEGVEPSADASAVARQLGLNVHTGILDDVTLPPQTFDCAAAWMVLEHVPEPQVTLRQLYSLLKPGGQLLLSIPNFGCWEPHVFRSAWFIWEVPRHLHHFTPTSIRQLLQRVGFTDVSIQHQRNVFNLICSLGIFLGRIPLCRRIGNRLLHYPEAPRLWIQILLSPLAHFLSAIRQGGRITVRAQRAVEENALAADSCKVEE
ncbi:MAG: class I SAM-dependent methyltransferase [Planctomycetaceae bacterium]